MNNMHRTQDKHWRSDMLLARRSRKRNKIELVQKVTGIDVKDNIGRTVLHYADKGNKLDIVTFFIRSGANVNVKTVRGRTILLSDIDRSGSLYNADMIKFSVRQGVDSGANYKGKIIPRSAVGCDSIGIIGFLICCDLDINAKNDNGETALHMACMSNDFYTVQHLLNNSADIEAKTNYDMNVLHMTIMKNDLDLVELLIERGAHINAENNKEETALDFARACNDLDIIRFLTDSDAYNSVNVKSDKTSLHSASHRGDWAEVVRIVVEGADINAKDHLGRTALHLASMLGDLDIVEFLVAYIRQQHWIAELYNGRFNKLSSINKAYLALADILPFTFET